MDFKKFAIRFDLFALKFEKLARAFIILTLSMKAKPNIIEIRFILAITLTAE